MAQQIFRQRTQRSAPKMLPRLSVGWRLRADSIAAHGHGDAGKKISQQFHRVSVHQQIGGWTCWRDDFQDPRK